MNKFCLALLMLGAWSHAGHALDQEQQRGRVLLETLCGRCHAVDATDQVRIQRHRHFEPSERSFMTMTWDSDCRTG